MVCIFLVIEVTEAIFAPQANRVVAIVFVFFKIIHCL
jgi:hypothetical protein